MNMLYRVVALVKSRLMGIKTGNGILLKDTNNKNSLRLKYPSIWCPCPRGVLNNSLMHDMITTMRRYKRHFYNKQEWQTFIKAKLKKSSRVAVHKIYILQKIISGDKSYLLRRQRAEIRKSLIWTKFLILNIEILCLLPSYNLLNTLDPEISVNFDLKNCFG